MQHVDGDGTGTRQAHNDRPEKDKGTDPTLKGQALIATRFLFPLSVFKKTIHLHQNLLSCHFMALGGVKI